MTVPLARGWPAPCAAASCHSPFAVGARPRGSTIFSRPASASSSPRLMSLHALRRAAGFADLGNARADQHAAGGDQHDLVVSRNELRGDELAVALAALDRDHALRAAAVARVLGDRRALAVAVLRRGEHRQRFVGGSDERDHLLARAQAACRARRLHCVPSARTSASAKRTALPASENSMMSCLPSVSATPIR